MTDSNSIPMALKSIKQWTAKNWIIILIVIEMRKKYVHKVFVIINNKFLSKKYLRKINQFTFPLHFVEEKVWLDQVSSLFLQFFFNNRVWYIKRQIKHYAP